MGYRRGYYKKDGTYVQGHYTKTRIKSDKNNKNKGCARVLISLFVILILINIS